MHQIAASASPGWVEENFFLTALDRIGDLRDVKLSKSQHEFYRNQPKL